MSNKLIQNTLFHGSWLLFLGYLLVYLIQGEDAVLRVHDNLDSELTFRLLPLRAGNLMGFPLDGDLPQIAEGIKRNYFYTGPFNIDSLFFLFLSPLWAYMGFFVLVKLHAFAGAFLLLRDYLFQRLEQGKLYAMLIACGFALLDFYTINGAGITGVPLLAWGFLKLQRNEHPGIWPYIAVLSFPFLTNISIGVLYVLPFVFAFPLLALLQKHGSWKRLLGLAMAFTLFEVLSELHLFQTVFGESVSMQRDVRAVTTHSWAEYGDMAIQMLLGDGIARHYPTSALVIMLMLGITILSNPLKHLKNQPLRWIFLGFLLLLAIFFFFSSELTQPLRQSVRLLRIYSFNKISFFLCLAYYLMLGFIVLIWKQEGKWLQRLILPALMLNILFTLWKNVEFKENIAAMLGRGEHITYRTYFAEELFDQVKESIDEPVESYRVGSIGISPSVTQLNGFNTIDGYLNIYPLDYKLKFRKVIERELAKNETARIYYDTWGSRVYLFIDEAWEQYLFTATGWANFFSDEELVLQNVELNPEALKSLDCKYLFSAWEIKKPEQSGLRLLSTHEIEGYFFPVFVYQVV